jgi:hypothetical protein
MLALSYSDNPSRMTDHENASALEAGAALRGMELEG